MHNTVNANEIETRDGGATLGLGGGISEEGTCADQQPMTLNISL